MSKSTRSQAFRKRAERGVSKALEGMHAIAIAGQHYRGYYQAADVDAILASLRGALDTMEQTLTAKSLPSSFAWPKP